jgi:hypothetical protein
MQQEPQPEHLKDLHAAALGQLGGQKRMAQLNSQGRSALARHAARARWHPREAQAEKERLEELARVVKQAIDDYLRAFRNWGSRVGCS